MIIKYKREQLEKIALFGGITAVVFEWIAILLFYFTSPADFGGEHPLSYFATLPQTRMSFAVCLSIAAISFWIFVKWHLSKHLKTPIKLFTFSMLSYLAVATVPFNMDKGLSENIHNLLTLFFTISLILCIYFMGKDNDDKKFKLFSFITVTATSILTIVMFIIPNKALFFILELLVSFICQLWTIGTTYYIYKLKSNFDTL